ncbi:vacuolar ATPase assembly integral membrane protein vma21 [Emydomyces testavorans]|uniref:Vacuolar ATPase assembly integral membrane protein vma21 n=1 Tax=Emydomyces testavorans TaxID=2070801 RepID=A0AAF0IK20_9EURO|nr:vacuolar ATPase assembly integral membrane protein vma21 [Emydomyces testavorans]
MATLRHPTKDTSRLSPPPPPQPEANPKPQTPHHPDAIPLHSLPGYPQQVLWKLLLYSIAVIVLPLAAFFYARTHLFDGDSTYAGAVAAVTANVVLFAYIVVAMREDRGEQEEVRAREREQGQGQGRGKEEEGKKTR